VPLYVWYAAGVRDLSPNCAGQGIVRDRGEPLR
jgi:hypothetical protein